MYRSIYILPIVFLIVSAPGVSCNKKAANSQPAIHVSERIKVERPVEPSVPENQEEEASKSTFASGADEKEIAAVQEPVKEGAVQEKPGSESFSSASGDSSQKQNVRAELSEGRAAEEKKVVSESPDEITEPGGRLSDENLLEITLANASENVSVKEIQKTDSDPVSELSSSTVQEKTGSEPDNEDLLGETDALFGSQEKYYVKKGRVDPFAPFLNKSELEDTDLVKEEIKRRTPRTPLERIAIGQLKLTAIMRLPDREESMALVEDNDGKGYIVKQGTYVGENGGRVAGIKADRLLVEEKYKDVFGKASVRQIELKLQKQLGE